MSEPFIAEIKIFAGNFAPRSYAFCDGQLLPISQNTALFSLIGTTYGGDGRTTTALPNLQGRAPMHAGRGPGLSSRKLGQKSGAETVTLSELQMPNHNHTVEARPSSASTSTPTNNFFANLTGANMYSSSTSSMVNMQAGLLQNAGGGQPHNNMQPFLAMNFIIALQGIYPSRG